MKKLIIIAIAALTVSVATAQTQAEKQIAADFVTERADAYVKGIKPVFVNSQAELNKIEATLDAGKVSYCKYSFIFLGDITEANLAGGGMNSYTQDVRKKVLYYTLVKENGRNVIWVISGHNGF